MEKVRRNPGVIHGPGSRKRPESGDGLSFQGPVPSDLFPPARTHLTKDPQAPKIVLSAEKHFQNTSLSGTFQLHSPKYSFE